VALKARFERFRSPFGAFGMDIERGEVSFASVAAAASATPKQIHGMIMRPFDTKALKIACASGAFGILACSIASWTSVPAAAENDSITIGVVLPLTGDAAHWGLPPRDGAEMAVDEINRAGGIGGRKLALVVEDDRCQPADGVSALNKIMAGANPAVVLGAVCSGVTLAMAPIAEAHKTVLISPASTSPKITDAGDFIFRVIPSGSLRGKVFADYLYNEKGLRKLAVLYIDNEGGIGGSNSFKAEFTRLGGTIAVEESYAQGATDIRAQLAKIKATDADGVMVGSYPPDTVLVLQQARELQLQLPLFIQTEAVQNPEVLRQAGDAANGVVYILAAPPSGEAPQKFTDAYETRFGRKPELFAAEGYDIVRLIAEAIAASNGTPLTGSSVRDFLYHVQDYAGASGAITFDKNGDVVKPFAIRTIEAGNPKTIVVK
jgi:branched-chain amino acid transport system substrate-binding protein